MKLGKWTSEVHAWSQVNGKPVTVADSVAMFGQPSGVSSAARLLRAAHAGGWFTREERDGRAVYMAVRRAEKEPPERRPSGDSYFDGLKRVRSVFELGDSL